eukprot:357381-Chlamydomonas_euryale.AAC.24
MCARARVCVCVVCVHTRGTPVRTREANIKACLHHRRDGGQGTARRAQLAASSHHRSKARASRTPARSRTAQMRRALGSANAAGAPPLAPSLPRATAAGTRSLHEGSAPAAAAHEPPIAPPLLHGGVHTVHWKHRSEHSQHIYNLDREASHCVFNRPSMHEAASVSIGWCLCSRAAHALATRSINTGVQFWT